MVLFGPFHENRGLHLKVTLLSFQDKRLFLQSSDMRLKPDLIPLKLAVVLQPDNPIATPPPTKWVQPPP